MTTTHTLTLELLTEELPPKALRKLGLAFAEGIQTSLEQAKLLSPSSTCQSYATPRRLALSITHVLSQAPDSDFSEKLMPVSIGLDAQGQATPALLKKLSAKGLDASIVPKLHRESDGKNEQLIYQGTAPGLNLQAGLQQALEYSISKLPIPKVMSYQLSDGVTTVKFVRPVHKILALYGTQTLPVQAFGLTGGALTQGHRFLSTQDIIVSDADAYPRTLLTEGYVLASFDERRTSILNTLNQQAQALHLNLGPESDYLDLLDEVTGLVEMPAVYVGKFDTEFLVVPPECLILTMRQNQKYFPLFDAQGQLSHQFLIVSNMPIQDPRHIIQGNERVVRPRLADARFFFETDKKHGLASRLEQLSHVVYHNKLGTQAARVQRLSQLAGWIAQQIGGDVQLAQRAGELSKSDLATLMVGEFPELQGIMGAYYAKNDHENPAVAQALGQQYRLRFDEPVTSDNVTSFALFLAERAETLVGMWSIGQIPTGDKDPFSLRRAALALISAFEQLDAGDLPQRKDLRLDGLLEHACQLLNANTSLITDLTAFIFERYRNLLVQDHSRAAIDAVIAIVPPLNQVLTRVQAVEQFCLLPEAISLAAANKRISNILKKQDHVLSAFDPALLEDEAEQALAKAINDISPTVYRAFEQGDFNLSLTLLAPLRPVVDAFFDDVMVMTDKLALRENRLALLSKLHGMMNQVADISRLDT